MRLKDKNIVKGRVISKEEKKRLLAALSYYTSIIFAMISQALNRIATSHQEHGRHILRGFSMRNLCPLRGLRMEGRLGCEIDYLNAYIVNLLSRE